MIRGILEKSVKEALGKLGLEADEVKFEHPDNLEHGDYSTNIALVLAKKSKEDPLKLSRSLCEALVKPKEVEKVEIAGPGFINFYLTKEFFAESLKEAIKEDFGKSSTNKGKKIILEYTDPNPFKVFHIGHLMTNTIGESLSRLAEFSGADVRRVNYYGDVGLHVAKSIWGRMQKPELSWGEAYAYGAQNYEQYKDDIDLLNKKIYERSDDEINKLYDKGKVESLEEFEKMYERLSTKFDRDFPESEVDEYGKEIIEKNANLFQKSDGAVVFKGENYGLHTRVFLNSMGLPTYEAKELGLAKLKHDYFPYDESVVITANEINEYFKVLLQVMKLVYEKERFADKTIHVGHGMLRLPEGKMGSRTGKVKAAEDLLNEIQGNVLEVMSEKEIKNREEISDMVALSAFKYTVLKQGIGKDIIFDFDKSISFEGDSGPYLQYSFVRAKSVQEIAKTKGLKAAVAAPEDWQLGEIERLIYRFPEVVERAWLEKAPQLVTNFLIELAGSFNSFYAKERIAEAGGEYKLLLTNAVANTLKNGLWLLGIKAPEKM